jgi:alpha-glucosidase (family GH31 glycosyl hydrolase)
MSEDTTNIRNALDRFASQRTKYVEIDDQIEILKKRIREDQEKVEALTNERKTLHTDFYNIILQFQPKTHQEQSAKRKKVTHETEQEQAIKQRLNDLFNDQATGLSENIKLFKHNPHTNTFTCTCEKITKIQLETSFTIQGQKRLLTLVPIDKSQNQYNVILDEQTKHIVTEFITSHQNK